VTSAVEQLTCVVADDHPAVLDSLSRVIEGHGIDVVARARDGEDAIRAIDEHHPVVAVIDLRMPGMSGMEVARRVVDRTRVILYTGHGDGVLVAEALAAGVKGFVLKEAPLGDVARAIQTVGSGSTYVDPVLAGALAAGEMSGSVKLLSQREREVMRLIARGYAYKEVARELFISIKTVETHMSSVLRKLQLSSRHELTRWASDRRLL